MTESQQDYEDKIHASCTPDQHKERSQKFGYAQSQAEDLFSIIFCADELSVSAWCEVASRTINLLKTLGCDTTHDDFVRLYEAFKQIKPTKEGKP